jgi:hypothetical protein
MTYGGIMRFYEKRAIEYAKITLHYEIRKQIAIIETLIYCVKEDKYDTKEILLMSANQHLIKLRQLVNILDGIDEDFLMK